MISLLGKFFPMFARPASRREELTELLQESLDDKTSFDSHEGTLLPNFLDLRDTTAADVMVPRADIVSVALAEGFDNIIQQMSDEAGRLFRLSIDSYIEGDSGLASALDDIDDRLDELNEETTKAVLFGHTNSEMELNVSVQLALVCRYYERIGDHSVNIGERVSYIVNGWMPENTGAIRAQHRIEKNIGAKELDGDS